MKKKLAIAAICTTSLLTGCATEGNFSKYSDHIQVKPMSRVAITGYSEPLMAYPGSMLKTTVQAQYGSLTLKSPTNALLNVLYDGVRYSITIKAGQYDIAGVFDWSDVSHWSGSTGIKYYDLKLIPVAGAGVIPGVSKIALAGELNTLANEDYKRGYVDRRFYAVQLESDHEWYVVVDDGLKISMPNDDFLKFDVTDIKSETIDLENGLHGSWQAYYIGTQNGTMHFNCGSMITSIAGIIPTPLSGGRVQYADACGKTIAIDSFLGTSIINYRQKIN